MAINIFKKEYAKLNKEQKEAVDAIEGPVMVVAGPGTGKTQILSLRIGNILLKTDVSADSILCLTFTNSGVRAMKERLGNYIGGEAEKVRVSTFHSFGIELIEKYYSLLGFPDMPKILSDDEAVFLVDDVLEEGNWEYLRPRTNPEMYFSDLKQLISILKRERLGPAEFLSYLEDDIDFLKNDKSSVSSRGESKGQLKKEVKTKIESLSRTKEVVEFYRIYEAKKREAGLMDYDDILEYTVRLAEEFEDVRSEIRENYLYVLIDEHQDSGGVQNNFLKAVWKEIENPNIFVVGDDRQLIYGFSGAALSYFEEFSHLFGKAKLIVLTENYRSSEKILALADDLLKSKISDEKLRSNIKVNHPNTLSEYNFPREEIIGAGIYFKKKIEVGLEPEECALLVPKNYQVREAIEILNGMGLPVSSGKNISFFDAKETGVLLRVLKIITNPYDYVSVSESLLDRYSLIPPLIAHKFLRQIKDAEKLGIEDLISSGKEDGLFSGENHISKWGNKLKGWLENLSNEKVSTIVGVVGDELLLDESKDHETLIKNVEIVRSFIHLAILFEEKNGENSNLHDFIKYLERLGAYGNHISLATFGKEKGIKVMTLHKSKGLEYKAVWVAHMNEEVLMSEKRVGFTLPEKVKSHISERDMLSSKRELYVAITRAKEFCNISYSRENYNGGEMELAEIIKELPEIHFIKKSNEDTEKELLSNGPKTYIPARKKENTNLLEDIKDFVKENYENTRISVSLLNNFFECPWRWYFRNFLKIPEVKSISLGLGSAVHSVIEYILKNKTLPKEAEINKKIESELKREGIKNTSDLKKLTKDGKEAVFCFINHFYKNLSEDYSSERSLQFRDTRFPNLLMYGKIDLSERLPGGNISVTDFKTGSVKSKNIIEKMDEEGRLSPLMRQLAMYSYLIQSVEKGREVEISRLLFLEAKEEDKNAVYTTHVDKEKIDLLTKDIGDYNELLKSGDWVNRPCYFRPFNKGDVCEYCKRASLYK